MDRGSLTSALPIDDVLDEICARLRAEPNLILIAPPGSGKTTRVAPKLIDAGLVGEGRKVLVLEPRRMAARLAAERVAFERGCRLGDEVGYQIRFERLSTNRTRILFLTEGILSKWLESDPLLEGVGAVVLDEFHERSVHADLALAFLKEVQDTVRPDLRIIVMSATLDDEPIASFLGHSNTVMSEGRTYPVELRWLDKPEERSISEATAAGVRRALSEAATSGDVLVFLPGAPEIRDTMARLVDPERSVLRDGMLEVLPLYGDLGAAEQDRAVRPGPKRKVILSTNIAESSLTIPGVSIVIDSGWAKVPRFDPSSGLDRLDLMRIGVKSREQRAGRAGRTGPGLAYRLWTKKEDQMLRPEIEAEILRVDLAPVLLDVLGWSERDPRTFGWFEAPSSAMIERGLGLLRLLGAVERDSFRLTSLGRLLARFPLHPRLARLLVSAEDVGRTERGALIASILAERDVLFGDASVSAEVGSSDVLFRADRLEMFERSRRQRLDAERLGVHFGTAQRVLKSKEQLLSVARRVLSERVTKSEHLDRGLDRESLDLNLVLRAYPDRVARKAAGEDVFTLMGGGDARLGKMSVVRASSFVVAVDVEAPGRGPPRGPMSPGGGSGGGGTGGGGARGRPPGSPPVSAGTRAWIRIASHVEPSWLDAETRIVGRWLRDRETAVAVEEVRYGALLLEERPAPSRRAQPSRGQKTTQAGQVSSSSSPETAVNLSALLAEAARGDLDRALPLTPALETTLMRYAFVAKACPELAWPPLEERAFREGIVGALSEGRRSFEELRSVSLDEVFRTEVGYEKMRILGEYAPLELRVPSGRSVRLRYEREDVPILSVKLQEMFGLYETPRVGGGRVPVKIELLSPSMRPVQVTQDLASFWKNTYQEVRKELRRRYPKHQWPEDPREGIASTKARPGGSR